MYLLGGEIEIFGDGNQTRSFLYIEECLDGILKLMESDFTGPVNTGNPVEFTILELAEQIIELTNSKSNIEFKDLPQDDPIQRQPDISLAKQALGWNPEIDLSSGLIKTIEYFRTN